MFTPSAPRRLFWKRQAVIEQYRRSKPTDQIYRTRIPTTRDEQHIICDRCSEEKAPIVGLVVMPQTDKAYFYCSSCFEQTPIVRRTHPDWRYFELSGAVNLEDLAKEMAAKGLLEPKA